MQLKSARGFTLIETILYLALFALIVSGLVFSAFLLFQSADRTRVSAMMLEEENFIMQKALYLVGQADSITVPSAGSSGTTLTIVDGVGATHTLTQSGSTALLNGSQLNSADVSVTQLRFVRSATTPDRITVEITAQARTPQGQLMTRSASSTKYVRQ